MTRFSLNTLMNTLSGWLSRYKKKRQSARLVQRLQRYYEEKKRQDTLERVWEHIAQKYDDSLFSSSE